MSDSHYPGTVVKLEGFHATEWLPFSPGRYWTALAKDQRREATKYISLDHDEYTPNGKHSMMRGGIGAIRLAEKEVQRSPMYFLGATSSGVAHQGVPIAVRENEYLKMMPTIKEVGGLPCDVDRHH